MSGAVAAAVSCLPGPRPAAGPSALGSGDGAGPVGPALGTGDCPVASGCATAGERTLLLFSVEVRNQGTADLALGNPTSGTNFAFNGCAGEYQYRDWYEFRLRNAAGSTVMVRRVSRYVSDTELFQPIGLPFPQFTCASQGLQHDWLCLHTNTLPCQGLDVTGLPGGNYTLDVEVNPARRFAEANYANNTIQVPFVLAACHALSVAGRSLEDLPYGNGNGALDPGETIREFVALANAGCTASGVTGIVSCATPGVTVLQGLAAYPTLPDGAAASNATAYTYRLSRTLACGTLITLRQDIVTAQGVFTNTWTRPVGQLQTLAILTNTYNASGLPIAIPTEGVVVSTNIIAASGITVIDDVNVLVRLDHASDLDLDLLLQPPTGDNILLARTDALGPNYGSGNNCATASKTIFDDEAAQSMWTGTPPFLGAYQPIEPLAPLDGRPVGGSWRLIVDDRIPEDGGTLKCWGLRVVYHTAQYVCSPFNNPPVASNALWVVGNLASNLVLRGSDPDGDPLRFRTNTPPAHGSLSGLQTNTGSVTYAPAPDYMGPDAFTFTVTDGVNTSAPAVMTLAVGDADADGMADSWEQRFLGGPAAAAPHGDADGDGVENLAEFLADANPTNGASVLPVITTYQRSAVQRLFLNWSSTGRLYDVWTATDLVQGAWLPAGLAAAGSGTGLVLTVTNAGVQVLQRVGIRRP